jgi:Helix-turn-helix domain
MSCHNLSVALRIKGLTLVERAVLHFLCDRERKGRCWPSVEEICWEYGLSRRAVLAAIGRLRSGQDKHGNTIPGPFIRVDVRYKQASIYHLLPFADPPRFKEVCGASHAPEMGATNAPEQPFSGAPDAPECGAPDAPENDIWGANFDISGVHDVHPESPKEESPKKEKKSASPPTRVRAREAEVSDVQQIVDAWNTMAKRSGLPPIRCMGEKRRRRLAARLRDHGLDGVLEAIEEIGASKFCCGEGPRGWKADFEFLLQETSMNRAREGHYRDREELSQHERIRREGGFGTFFGSGDDDAPNVIPMDRRALA